MQVSAFCFDWSEVRKRSSAQQIVDEMILTDDIDLYTKPLPEGIWPSDSALQHFETAEELAEARAAHPADRALQDVAALVSNGESIDELGLSPLTEGCYFIALSPERVAALLPSFQAVAANTALPLSPDARDWLAQWTAALTHASNHKLGLIGHCG